MTQPSDIISTTIAEMKVSSKFRSGDQGSFKVKLVDGKYELPGKDDPGDYFNRLGLEKIKGDVGVIFPGNGGICVEALKRGASNVWAIEPRDKYHETLANVTSLTSTAISRTFNVVHDPREGFGLEKFDYVIWTEGLQDLKDPVTSIGNILALLKPGGKLFLEVTHGQQDAPVPPVSCWLPKEQVFVEILAKVTNNAPTRILKGRLERRFIYEVSKPVIVVVSAEAVAEAITAPPAIKRIAGTAAIDAEAAPKKEKRVSLKKKKGKVE